mmetsp:Transcript_4072/g.15712  ORF Transcript_4072/g.15712 Transcript_4072/m.15712 type:complete len:219 (-) Transcript_4072:2150-2806(-)
MESRILPRPTPTRTSPTRNRAARRSRSVCNRPKNATRASATEYSLRFIDAISSQVCVISDSTLTQPSMAKVRRLTSMAEFGEPSAKTSSTTDSVSRDKTALFGRTLSARMSAYTSCTRDMTSLVPRDLLCPAARTTSSIVCSVLESGATSNSFLMVQYASIAPLKSRTLAYARISAVQLCTFGADPLARMSAKISVAAATSPHRAQTCSAALHILLVG